MRYITSCNIACGGHAGDENTMRATVEQAMRHKVAIGAHPGYADRENFGRAVLRITEKEIADSVFQQIQRLAGIAAECGAQITHVKAHGALYNQAAREPAIARAIAEGVSRWNKTTVLVGLAGSRMLDVFRNAGFKIAAEAFADRRYEPDGSLRSRKFDDALITDPAQAAAQALGIAQRGIVTALNGVEIPIDAQTICIHSDTPDAQHIAAAVAAKLRNARITLRSIGAASS